MGLVKSAVRPILGGLETVNAIGNTGATATANIALGNLQTATLTANCTFTFSGATTGKVCSFTLQLTQDGTGSRTATWPGSVVWPGASAPTLATAAASVDLLTFYTTDGGTTWYGFHNTKSAVTDATISTSDITTNNASTSKHGWTPKLDNVSTHFLSGTGAWGTPAGTGAVASDPIWDAAGDLAQGTGADTAAKLSAGLTGKVLQAAGAAAALAWKYPPGYEFDYVEFTSAVTITATTEGTATTIVTGSAVTYDGSQIVLIEFYTPYIQTGPNQTLYVVLYDGASSIGKMGVQLDQQAAQNLYQAFYAARRLTPSNAAHTYSIRSYVASGSATADAGAGGNGNDMPGYIRITKVSGGA